MSNVNDKAIETQDGNLLQQKQFASLSHDIHVDTIEKNYQTHEVNRQIIDEHNKNFNKLLIV